MLRRNCRIKVNIPHFGPGMNQKEEIESQILQRLNTFAIKRFHLDSLIFLSFRNLSANSFAKNTEDVWEFYSIHNKTFLNRVKNENIEPLLSLRRNWDGVNVFGVPFGVKDDKVSCVLCYRNISRQVNKKCISRTKSGA